MKKRMWIGMLVLLACTACVSGAPRPEGRSGETVVRELLALNWIPVKLPHLEPGARMSITEGDLAKPGPVVFYLYLPANYTFPAHFHDTAEELRILSGVVYLGGMDGHPFDRAAGKAHGAGSVHQLPPHTPHWAFTNTDSVVLEVRTTGPYSIHWMENPQ